MPLQTLFILIIFSVMWPKVFIVTFIYNISSSYITFMPKEIYSFIWQNRSFYKHIDIKPSTEFISNFQWNI